MNGLGLIVTGPWPQFTVALALTSALTSATAGTSRSKASWTDRAEDGEGMAARPAPAASSRAHRTLDARALIGSAPDILPPREPPGRAPTVSGLRLVADDRPCRQRGDDPERQVHQQQVHREQSAQPEPENPRAAHRQ